MHYYNFINSYFVIGDMVEKLDSNLAPMYQVNAVP